MHKIFGLLCLFFLIGTTTHATAGTEIRVNFSTGHLEVVSGGQKGFTTKVVLPRGNFYNLPARGTVTVAEMGPTWIPTQNTRKAQPGLKAYYGPYAAGNAMGHCKISINYDAGSNVPSTVRIHGNAREADYGQRLSRGCVRVHNNFCQTLVDTVRRHQRNGPVRVLFHN